MINNTQDDYFFPYKYIREPTPYDNNTSYNNTDSPLWSKPGAPVFMPILPDAETYDALMKAWPQTTRDILTPDHRCGRGAWNTTGKTVPIGGGMTADVLAGSNVTVTVERYSLSPPRMSPQSYDYIGHIGPGMAYLAKKPEGVTLSDWDGDGDWFKIDYTGPKDNETWTLFHQKQYSCTHIPTP